MLSQVNTRFYCRVTTFLQNTNHMYAIIVAHTPYADLEAVLTLC